MLRMKLLQILNYTLKIIYVFAIERNATVNNSMQILPYNYVEYVKPLGTNNSYLKTYADDVRHSRGTIQPLLVDHLKYNRENVSNFESIENFNGTIDNRFTSNNQMKNTHIVEEDQLFMHATRDQKDVQNLTIKSASTEWIILAWQAPPYINSENETLTYSIDVYSAEYILQKNGTATEFNVTYLEPCSEYMFIVKVIGTNWKSDGVKINGTTSFNITEIGNIEEPVTRTTTNNITLSWKAPKKYSKCVRSYLIKQCFKDNCNNTEVSHEKYNSTELEPCNKYLFIIRCIAHNRSVSNGVNITLKTKSPKSSKPQNPIVEANAFSLFIHWEAPKVGAMCVKHYQITVSPQLSTRQTAQTNITINDLYACTPYYIYINAVDKDNNDGEMSIIQSITAPAVPRSPILDSKNPIISKNDVMLLWKIEKGNSNCTLKSLKVLCNFTTTDGHGYEVKNGNAEVSINSRIQDEFLIVNSIVKDISPFTTYICGAYVTNEAGNSELSTLIHVTTLEDIPSAPLFNVTNVTHSHFVFVWDSPIYLAGSLHEFKIVLERQIRFPMPDYCKRKDTRTTVYLNGSTFILGYHQAEAYTIYNAKIKARTNAGWGNYSSNLIFQTPAAVPGMVSNLSYSVRSSEDDMNVLDTILTWGFPCSLNGMLEYFNILVYGSRANYKPHAFMIKKYVSNDIINDRAISINLKELKAQYNYTFNVSAKVNEVQDLGVPASKNLLYPAGIPSQPNVDYIKSITIDPVKARKSITSATLLLPLFPDINGTIVYYSIIVSRMEYNISSSTRFDMTNHTWPNISSWKEAMLKDFMIPYQATRLWWNPYPNYIVDYGDVKAVKYTLGEDKNCEEISSKANKRTYCNGPLKPNTWYHVKMRAFTYGGYSDSAAFLIKTNAEINIGLVSGIVFGILLLGTLTTMMVFVCRFSPQVILRKFLHSGMSGSPVPAAFTKKKFMVHCQQLNDNPGKLSNEFRLLQTLSIDLQMPMNTACLQANKKKNRYSDILPYDFSRVKIDVVDNDPTTDYINASFIKGYSEEDEYIACQGPKEETTFDFWRMVEQYNVNMIVMLTQLVEKGKEKCHQYFPTIREMFKYENMTIECISELDYTSYTQRTLILQKENKNQHIIHLHYKTWPDHGIPEDFDSMINFCKIMRCNIITNKGYIVTHCSAGIGRTGTLIAIDILLQNLCDNKKLDVFGTVYKLRYHRINMVQKESQYAYIYNCIKQVLKNPYCLKSYKPFHVNSCNQSISKKGKDTTNFKNNSSQQL